MTIEITDLKTIKSTDDDADETSIMMQNVDNVLDAMLQNRTS